MPTPEPTPEPTPVPTPVPTPEPTPVPTPVTPPQGGPLDLVEWELSAYLDGESLVSVPAGVKATAVFGIDPIDPGAIELETDPEPPATGSVTGTAGCSPYRADITVNEPGLSIAGLNLTIGSCVSPAADVEAKMLTNLLRVTAYTATPDALELHGVDGGVLLSFVAGAPTVRPSPSPLPTAAPTPTPSPLATAAPTPTPTPAGRQARITRIRVRDGRYVVDYEVFGYRQELPGRHVHFFFDSVPPREAGVPGSGPWILYAGPSPFTRYSVSDRPDGASQMCILVANPDHSVIRRTGNCVDLPR